MAEMFRRRTFLTAVSTAAAGLVDGTLYVVGNDGTVFALDRVTGEITWIHSLDAPVENSMPIVSGGYLWVPSLDGTLYALRG